MGDGATAQGGGSLVGHAIDNSVSGSVNPLERPGLGPWLTHNGMKKWDTLLFARDSRASRETLDMLILLRMVENEGKRLVILDPPFDSATASEVDRSMLVFRTEMNRMMRVDTITNVRRQVARDRQMGKWLGGPVPFWLRKVPHESGDGWKLELTEDDVSLAIVKELLKRLLKGERPGKICGDFNKRNLPMPSELRIKANPHSRAKRSKYGRRGWNPSSVRAVAENRLLIGQKEVVKERIYYVDGKRKKEEVARYVERHPAAKGEEIGKPVQFAPPLLTEEQFNQINGLLSMVRPKLPQSNNSPLFDVAFCLECGSVYYVSRNKVDGKIYPTYRCAMRHTSGGCKAKSLPEKTVLDEIGTEVESWRNRTVFIPDESESVDLSAMVAQKRADQEVEATLMKKARTEEAKSRRLANFEQIESEIETLESLMASQSERTYSPTGRNFGDIWDGMDWHERGDLLRRCGVRFGFKHDDGGMLIMQVSLPKDIDAIFADLGNHVSIKPALGGDDMIGRHAATIQAFQRGRVSGLEG